MDFIAILKELNSYGFAEVIGGLIICLGVRHTVKYSDGGRVHNPQKVKKKRKNGRDGIRSHWFRSDVFEFTALRQDINESASASEKRDKEIILNLMDVRERLANVEGRLGMITYRQDIVPPPNLPQPENIEESPEREIVS